MQDCHLSIWLTSMPKPLIVIKELFAQECSHRHSHRHPHRRSHLHSYLHSHLHPHRHSHLHSRRDLICHVQDALDLSWSPDGYTLLCCSMDGGLSNTPARATGET